VTASSKEYAKIMFPGDIIRDRCVFFIQIRVVVIAPWQENVNNGNMDF